MPWELQRYQQARCLHFITFSCYHRAQRFTSAAASRTVVTTLERVRGWYGFCIKAYVVMPQHVHLLISEPERAPLSTAIQMLKPPGVCVRRVEPFGRSVITTSTSTVTGR